DELLLGERLVAIRRRARVVAVRYRLLDRSLRGGELRARLADLRVELRRVDLGEQLAFLDLVADVDEPAADVAARARIQLGLLERLDRAGQLERAVARERLR